MAEQAPFGNRADARRLLRDILIFSFGAPLAVLVGFMGAWILAGLVVVPVLAAVLSIHRRGVRYRLGGRNDDGVLASWWNGTSGQNELVSERTLRAAAQAVDVNGSRLVILRRIYWGLFLAGFVARAAFIYAW